MSAAASGVDSFRPSEAVWFDRLLDNSDTRGRAKAHDNVFDVLVEELDVLEQVFRQKEDDRLQASAAATGDGAALMAFGHEDASGTSTASMHVLHSGRNDSPLLQSQALTSDSSSQRGRRQNLPPEAASERATAASPSLSFMPHEGNSHAGSNHELFPPPTSPSLSPCSSSALSLPPKNTPHQQGRHVVWGPDAGLREV